VQAAQASAMPDAGPVTEATFKERLGVAGEELLKAGLDGLVRDVNTVLPFLRSRATGSE
jgi:hypothetical protein